MTQVIYKYKLNANGLNELFIPKNGKILCVQEQRGEPHIWVLIDKDQTIEEKRKFIIIGTGHDCNIDLLTEHDYVGTFQLGFGELVFHVFVEM